MIHRTWSHTANLIIHNLEAIADTCFPIYIHHMYYDITRGNVTESNGMALHQKQLAPEQLAAVFFWYLLVLNRLLIYIQHNC